MKWQRITILCVVFVTVLFVTGCGLFSDNKKIDYRSTGKLPPLDVPPDLTVPPVDERYTIPDGDNSSNSTTFSTYNQEREGQPLVASSTSSLLPLSDHGIHIERAGTQRWLVVPQAPEAVWPILKEFWQELGFLIKMETPETGILETDWAENRAVIKEDIIRRSLIFIFGSIYSNAERDKFRTRLERGEGNTTEVYISHRGMNEVVEGGSTDRTIWQPRPADPELEAEMLSRLMLRFGAKEDYTKQELDKSNNITKINAYIDTEQRGVLIVNEAFDRSWRRVGLALDRIGFTVEDRNRQEGIYFVRYIDPDSDAHERGTDDGIFSKLFSWGDKETTTNTEKFHIQVNETSTSSSEVKVLDEENTPLNDNTAINIIDLLYEQVK